MPETLEALLWCAALATWLMMLFTIVKDGVNKIVDQVRGRRGGQQKTLRTPSVGDGRRSRVTWRPE